MFSFLSGSRRGAPGGRSDGARARARTRSAAAAQQQQLDRERQSQREGGDGEASPASAASFSSCPLPSPASSFAGVGGGPGCGPADAAPGDTGAPSHSAASDPHTAGGGSDPWATQHPHRGTARRATAPPSRWSGKSGQPYPQRGGASDSPSPSDQGVPNTASQRAGSPDGGDPGLRVSYFVTIHEIWLNRDIATGSSTVHLECGGAKCHIPVQDCFRRQRQSLPPGAAGLGAETPGQLKVRFTPASPFVDLYIYTATEGILTTEVTGQVSVPLSPLFCEDHHERCRIVQQTYAFWYFKGKHLPKYPSGIPEVPTSALKIPKRVGYVVVSVSIQKTRYISLRYGVYTAEAPKPKQAPQSGGGALGIDEIEEKIFRILRVYERFILRVQTPPWWLETCVFPLLTFERQAPSLCVMGVIAVSCLTTPAHLLLMDAFLATFCLSILSKDQKHIECICWSDDPRLREPEGHPHTIVGQLFYAKRVLDQFVYKVETLLFLAEMLPTSLDWTDPLVTLTLFGLVFAAVWMVSCIAYLILMLYATFGEASLRVILLGVLWLPFAGGVWYREAVRQEIDAEEGRQAGVHVSQGGAWEDVKERAGDAAVGCGVFLRQLVMRLPSVPELEHRHIASQQRVHQTEWKRADEKLCCVPLPTQPTAQQQRRAGSAEDPARRGAAAAANTSSSSSTHSQSPVTSPPAPPVGAPSSNPSTPSTEPATLSPQQQALSLVFSPLSSFRRRGKSQASVRSESGAPGGSVSGSVSPLL